MKNLVIARRYAKALLLIGKEDGQTETYREELNSVAELMARESEFSQIISNPLHDVAARRNIVEAVLKRLNLSKVMNAFLLLLFDKGRVGFVGSINDFYHKLADELKGIARANLVSATELSTEAIEKIRSSLSQKTGKDIVLSCETDPSLIGGIVTRIGDLVLDGSIKTQLRNMRESLKRGETV